MEIYQKQMVYYSEKYAKKQEKNRDKAIAKAKELISNPVKYTRATTIGAAGYVNKLACRNCKCKCTIAAFKIVEFPVNKDTVKSKLFAGKKTITIEKSETKTSAKKKSSKTMVRWLIFVIKRKCKNYR